MTDERDYHLISRRAALRRILKLTASCDQLIPSLFPSRDFALKTVHLSVSGPERPDFCLRMLTIDIFPLQIHR